MLDAFQRPLRSLRLSVTDRCNLRCNYCMPEPEYTWLPRADVLSFEELERLARVFTRLGVDRLRLTGGEPLLRRDLPELVRGLRRAELSDLSMTTNAVRLTSELATELRAAGLDRITVSMDTLQPERFRALTGRDALAQTQAGIDAALAAGFPVKLNTVVINGFNDDELGPLLERARDVGAEQRFIEYMDVGGATEWAAEKVLSRREILARLEGEFGGVTSLPASSAPAQRFQLEDGTVFGIISSTTQPFCASCDRARVTADGSFYLCLYARDGLDLRAPLRAGRSDDELLELIGATWSARSDRGAEERLKMPRRIPLAKAAELRGDPHLEMHTRGG